MPKELTDAFNPAQDIIRAMPEGEGSIEFDWVKQKYVGKFRDMKKDFLRSKWHDKAEGATKAARGWLQELRG